LSDGYFCYPGKPITKNRDSRTVVSAFSLVSFPFLYLYYSTVAWVCQALFLFFLGGFCFSFPHPYIIYFTKNFPKCQVELFADFERIVYTICPCSFWANCTIANYTTNWLKNCAKLLLTKIPAVRYGPPSRTAGPI